MSEAKATVLLPHYLKQLKLPSFLREYEKLAAVCQQERDDYQTYLLRLAEVELADRERRAAERRVKAARFPVLKTLDTFDFKAQPALNQELVRQLLRGEYLDRRENVLLSGRPDLRATVAPARRIWPRRWPSPLASRAAACASSPPPAW